MKALLLLSLCVSLTLEVNFAHPDSSGDSGSEYNDEDFHQDLQQSLVDDEEDYGEFRTKVTTDKSISTNRREAEMMDACLQPRTIGKCKMFLPRYYFNIENKHCERFAFGGCGGNENNFQSLVACEDRCALHLKSDTHDTESLEGDDEDGIVEEICELPPFEGRTCHAYLPRWTFNLKENKCVQFIYTGCGGTLNMYLSRYECQQTCGNYRPKSTEVMSTTTLPPDWNIAGSVQKKFRICDQPMDVGYCFGTQKRYYFNKESNRCLSFTFNGCGGNDNNFQNSDECLRTCGGSTPANNVACTHVTCPMNLYTHYTTLGCQPIYDGNACCPTRYNCQRNTANDETTSSSSSSSSSISTSTFTTQLKCQYRGKFYSIGDQIHEASSTSACRAACTCTSFDEKPRINCASIECPENLGARPPGKENCTLLYKRGGCCAHDYWCASDMLVQDLEGQGELQTQLNQESKLNPDNFRCIFEGKEYVEGEKLQPRDDTCRDCICQKGFNGTLTDTICEPIDCGIEIYYANELQRGCVPVYYQDIENRIRCCPIGWECPDEVSLPTTTVRPKPTLTPLLIERIPPLSGFRPMNIPRVQIPISFDNRMVTTEACSLDRQTGPCKAARPRYYFNLNTKLCTPFTYGGCGGNKNNFVSLKDCQTVCEANVNDFPTMLSPISRGQAAATGQPKTYELTQEDPCTQEPKLGPCRGYYKRYYFSPEVDECRQFVYGGCRGNKNNFFTPEACGAFCQNKIPVDYIRPVERNSSTETPTVRQQTENPDTLLQQRPDIIIPVIDITSRRNLSVLRPEVTQVVDITHEDPCNLPPSTGICKGHLHRYYYDSSSQNCKLFTYGGCGGNENNFLRFKECELRCSSNKGKTIPEITSSKRRTTSILTTSDKLTAEYKESSVKAIGFFERCHLPMEVGPCNAKILSYYYDVETQGCKNFTYRGCFGNANRFSSKLECESICKETEAEVVTGMSRPINGVVIPGGPNSRPRPILPTIHRVISNSDYSYRTTINSDDMATDVLTQDNDEYREICSLPVQQGNCRGHNLRYHWNEDLEQCLPFVYSGCRGNKNNFLSESDCLSTCDQEPTVEKLTQEGVLTCTFGNETIPIGGYLGGLVKQTGASSCGTPLCQCITPPALTCIQKRCPTLPFLIQPIKEEQKPITISCPVLECPSDCRPNSGSVNRCPSCDCSNVEPRLACPIGSCPITCRPSLRLDNGCPTCDCSAQNRPDCPTLICLIGCRPRIRPETGCPTCECSESIKEQMNIQRPISSSIPGQRVPSDRRPRCQPVRCSTNCRLTLPRGGNNVCPTCNCE